jgi:hypothetical protein
MEANYQLWFTCDVISSRLVRCYGIDHFGTLGGAFAYIMLILSFVRLNPMYYVERRISSF